MQAKRAWVCLGWSWSACEQSRSPLTLDLLVQGVFAALYGGVTTRVCRNNKSLTFYLQVRDNE
jgi:hypothetical protein